jgi:hypothetical protein
VKRDPLWGHRISEPTPVIAVITEEFGDRDTFAEALREDRARRDDAYWNLFVRQPFTWQRFLNWWVARRWVRPRDIRKD